MPIRKEYRHYYQTEEWRSARELVLERAQFCCERCGRPQGAEVLSFGSIWFCPVWKRWRSPASILVDLRDPLERGNFVLPPACAKVYIVEVQLGVAHINHDPSDLDLRNLAAWCRTCHLLFDRDKHRETRETRKDSGRPLLAGLM